MIGNEKLEKTISSFQPQKEVANLTKKVRDDYTTGHNTLHQSYREFDDKSLIQRMDMDQKAFNAYVEPKSNNPDEAWRWNGRRPVTRNKLIGIAAQVTAAILIPNVFAQNDQDEEDKQAANVMRDLIEWNIKNSDYEDTFLFSIIAALVNPAAFIKEEFVEVLQKVKTRSDSGEITVKEVIDEVLSGLKIFNVPVDEMLISNIYEFDLQRQRFLIRRRFIDYDEAEALYGEHNNFKHIRPGVTAFLSDEDGMFYEQKDDQLQGLVEETIYYNRREDIEIPLINGIYMGSDDTEDNPMKHRRMVRDLDGDPISVPIYPFVKFGYEPVDERRFFYYKSAAAKIAKDNDLLDTMWRMIMDGTFLSVMPPVGISGDEDINSDVIFPGAVTNMAKDTKIEPINVGQNLMSGFSAIQALEQSITESSQESLQAGKSMAGQQTAFEVAKLEQNARIQLGLFGKMIGKAVVDLGYLMIDDIVAYQTVGNAEEVSAGNIRLKFRKFLLGGQIENGKQITKKIIFTDELMGMGMTKDQIKKEGFKMMKEEGGFDSSVRIVKVNPALFARLKFLISIEPDNLIPQNKAFEKAMKLEAHDRMILSPFANLEAIERDFLFDLFAKGEAAKYMKKPTQVAPQAPTGLKKPATTELVEQMTGSNSINNLLGQQ